MDQVHGPVPWSRVLIWRIRYRWPEGVEMEVEVHKGDDFLTFRSLPPEGTFECIHNVIAIFELGEMLLHEHLNPVTSFN